MAVHDAKDSVFVCLRNARLVICVKDFNTSGGTETMRKRQVISLAICLCLGIAPYALAAASYDGSVPLLCAVIEVFDCQGGGDWQRGTAESVNLPQLRREQTVYADQASRTYR